MQNCLISWFSGFFQKYISCFAFFCDLINREANEEVGMEQRLRRLYDYQRFESNPRLKKMLDDALGRYDFSVEGALSDDDAELLNAAGTTVATPGCDREKRS